MNGLTKGVAGRGFGIGIWLGLLQIPNALQAVGAITIHPPFVCLKAVEKCEFTAEVNGTPDSVEWTVEEPGGGPLAWLDIGKSLCYVAPMRGGTFHIRASLVTNPSVYATATITVAPVEVRVTPSTATLSAGGSIDFKGECTVSQATLHWQMQEENGGDIFDSPDAGEVLGRTARYTAPLKTGTYHVRAKIVQPGPPVEGSASIIVVPPKLSIEPPNATVEVYGQQQFQAVLPDGVNPSLVSWNLQEPNGGLINWTGFYMALGEPGTFHLVAQIEATDPPSEPVLAKVMVVEKKDPGGSKNEGTDVTEDQADQPSSLPRSNRLAISALRPVARQMQNKPGEVLILFWDWKSGGVLGSQASVGHVAAAISIQGEWTIIHSQFPHDTGGPSQPIGANTTIASPTALFNAEGQRKPNSAYLVMVPNLGGFADYTMHDLERPFWVPDPGRPWNSTNCTYGTIHGLRAGGVPLSTLWINQTLIIPGTPYLPRDLRTALKRDEGFNSTYGYTVLHKNELIDAFQWEVTRHD